MYSRIYLSGGIFASTHFLARPVGRERSSCQTYLNGSDYNIDIESRSYLSATWYSDEFDAKLIMKGADT